MARVMRAFTMPPELSESLDKYSKRMGMSYSAFVSLAIRVFIESFEEAEEEHGEGYFKKQAEAATAESISDMKKLLLILENLNRKIEMKDSQNV